MALQRSPLLLSYVCVSAIGAVGWIHVRRPPAAPPGRGRDPASFARHRRCATRDRAGLPSTPAVGSLCGAGEGLPRGHPARRGTDRLGGGRGLQRRRLTNLAAPARPIKGRLTIINADTADWILQDPSAPPLGPRTEPPPAPVVGKGDMLLASASMASERQDGGTRRPGRPTCSRCRSKGGSPCESRKPSRAGDPFRPAPSAPEGRPPLRGRRGPVPLLDRRSLRMARRKPPIRADPPPTSSGGSGAWSCLRPSAAATIGNGQGHIRAPTLPRDQRRARLPGSAARRRMLRSP